MTQSGPVALEHLQWVTERIESRRNGLWAVVASGAGFFGLLLWYVVWHASEIPDNAIFPSLSVGGLVYLLLAGPALRQAVRHVMGNPPLPVASGGGERARWHNLPEAFALMLISAWANSRGLLWLPLTIVLVVWIFFLILPQTRVEANLVHALSRLWQWSSAPSGHIFAILVVVMLPAVGIVFISPLEAVQKHSEATGILVATVSVGLIAVVGLLVAKLYVILVTDQSLQYIEAEYARGMFGRPPTGGE